MFSDKKERNRICATVKKVVHPDNEERSALNEQRNQTSGKPHPVTLIVLECFISILRKTKPLKLWPVR